MLSSNFLRAILASAVQHHDFVRNALERFQRAQQVLFFIQRNQAGGEAIHHAPGKLEIAASISQRVFCRAVRKSGRYVLCLWVGALSQLKTHPNHAFADPKFGSILQHRRAHALLVEKRSVRGIHVFQVDVGVANFQQAMTS